MTARRTDEHETVTRSYVDLSEEPTFTDRADSMPLGGNYDGKDGKASTSRSPSPPQPPSSATGGFPVTPTSAQFASVGSANLAAIREVTPTSTPLMMSRSQSRNDGQAMGAGSEKAHSSYPSARETHEAPASVSSSASASGNGSTSSIKGKGKDRDLSSEDEEVTRRCSGPDGLRVPVTMLESAFAGNVSVTRRHHPRLRRASAARRMLTSAIFFFSQISTSSEQGDSAENVRAESSNGTSAGAGARAGAAPAPAVGSGNSNNVEGGRQ